MDVSRIASMVALAALFAAGGTSAAAPAPAPTGATADPEALSPEEAAFAEELAHRTFDYFWETTDADDCLAPDRWPSVPFSSIAATGFALTAYGIGAERGYVARAAAAGRTLRCLETYLALPQGPAAAGVSGYKGFFYHFLRMDDGTRHRNTELSSVDTSLLFAGVLFAQSYFDRDDPVERAIRETADALYRRADWTFFLRGAGDPPAANLATSKGLAMGWKPGLGFESHDWVGYNEGMLIYVLALGSPTHPVTRRAWDEGWAARLEEDWATYYDHEHLNFEPLFGHQYSHVWIDFRGIRDAFMRGKGIDYFENSRRATLAQYEYAQDNPNRWVGYGGNVWGLTACDGPGGSKSWNVRGEDRRFMNYAARGASAIRVVDDGTIAPTAAGGSVAFAPVLSIRALMAMRDRFGEHLYTEYGFRDSFNQSVTFDDYDGRSGTVIPGLGWVANDYLGIDQGPILAMLENQRSELVWRTMRKNPYIRKGLEAIGFEGGWLDETVETRESAGLMTFNIRTAAAADGANAWPHRAADVAAVVLEAEPDIVGFQEAEPEQVAFLAKELRSYSWVGRSREADPRVGEAVPVFFHNARWRLDPGESGTFWLSDTPADAGSRTWGNHYPRIATWARLVHRETGRGLYVFNLHLDHESEPSRIESAKLVSRRAAQRRYADPVVVMGDLNAPPDSAVLCTLKDGLGLEDSFAVHAGDDPAAGTFHAFTGDAAGRRIDFILVPDELRVVDAAIDRSHGDGRFPSDHYPVTATVVLDD